MIIGRYLVHEIRIFGYLKSIFLNLSLTGTSGPNYNSKEIRKKKLPTDHSIHMLLLSYNRNLKIILEHATKNTKMIDCSYKILRNKRALVLFISLFLPNLSSSFNFLLQRLLPVHTGPFRKYLFSTTTGTKVKHYSYSTFRPNPNKFYHQQGRCQQPTKLPLVSRTSDTSNSFFNDSLTRKATENNEEFHRVNAKIVSPIVRTSIGHSILNRQGCDQNNANTNDILSTKFDNTKHNSIQKIQQSTIDISSDTGNQNNKNCSTSTEEILSGVTCTDPTKPTHHNQPNKYSCTSSEVEPKIILPINHTQRRKRDDGSITNTIMLWGQRLLLRHPNNHFGSLHQKNFISYSSHTGTTVRGQQYHDTNRRHFLTILSLGTASSTIAPVIAAAPAEIQQQVQVPTTTIVSSQISSSLPDEAIESTRISTFSGTTIIPYSSVRKYKRITLPTNGVQVVLVSDKAVYNSACAVSVRGAGQFSDPDDIPGLSHLMEHIILSSSTALLSTPPTTNKRSEDFEDWINEKCDGISNGFTAYQYVCFYFSFPNDNASSNNVLFPEALRRFAALFNERNVMETCMDAKIVKREIRRVNTELNDLETDAFQQQEYLTKGLINLEHPYSRFAAGNKDTLEKIPKKQNININQRLMDHYKELYVPNQITIVVCSSQELSTLERWVQPFSTSFSYKSVTTPTPIKPSQRRIPPLPMFYPGQFLYGNRYKHMVLLAPSGTSGNSNDKDTSRLTMEWTFNNNYQEMIQYGKPTVTATQIGFVLAQIFGRRGPGSLYVFLNRRGWVASGPNGLPRITVPVETSGFQIIRLELNLSVDGMGNRVKVVTAIYDCIESLRRKGTDSFIVPRTLLTQYASMALLIGYQLASRPPDTIELALDIQTYSIDSVVQTYTIGGSRFPWYRFPSPEDINGLLNLQNGVSTALLKMSDPDSTVIIATATSKTLGLTKADLPDSSTTSIRWLREPISGARFYYEDMIQWPLGRLKNIERFVLTKIIDREELLPPTLNPLIPTILRPPRYPPVSLRGGLVMNDNTVIYRTAQETDDDNVDNLRRFRIRSDAVAATTNIADSASTSIGQWELLEPTIPGQLGIQLPKGPPEPTCRAAFVLEFLSSRPARANVRQAARAELWKLAFEDLGGNDLAELGAPGGLSYDISFNKYGLRIVFVGPSQTLPSYARRMMRRFVEYPFNLRKTGSSSTLTSGIPTNMNPRTPVMLPSSITNRAIAIAKQYGRISLSQGTRNRMIISNLRTATAFDVGDEGVQFLCSCNGAVAFAQGDLLHTEGVRLLKDLQEIYQTTVTELVRDSPTDPTLFRSSNLSPSISTAAIPSITDLLYKPVLKPRYGSPCSVPGVILISDACGRVAR